MIIGVPKEVKDQEFRVGATPTLVKALVKAGHTVLVQKDAGKRIGFRNDLYEELGGKIVDTPEAVYDAEMIIKVKEPQPSEYPLLKEAQILFCYLHLAPDPKQTEALLKQKIVGIAYETVTDKSGEHLPLLLPMSEIAGRFAVQAGATALQIAGGGKGILLGGVPGVLPAKVTIIGGGVAGTQAMRVAMGLGADVTVLDIDPLRLRELDEFYGPALKTRYSNTESIFESVVGADMVVGAVLVPGKKAPNLVTKEMVKEMSAGSVILDIAIDQGGCVETARPTTHSDPTFIVDDVIHYCVANIPGGCAKTSTLALGNATFSSVMALANKGYKQALKESFGLQQGLNVWHGHVTHESVAADLGYSYLPPEEALS
jgi:alanine dehydrogenase